MKGFIRICCCEDCTVEYHVTCWKTLKASAFSEKSEKVNLDLVTSSFCVFCCFLVITKLQFPDLLVFVLQDLLQEACLTPDCIGQICSITIFCPTGVVKCKVRGESSLRGGIETLVMSHRVVVDLSSFVFSV